VTTFVHLPHLAAALDLFYKQEDAKQPPAEGHDLLIIDKKYMKEFKDTYLPDVVPLSASLRFHIVLLLNYVDLGSIPFFTQSGVVCIPDPPSHDNLVSVLNEELTKGARVSDAEEVRWKILVVEDNSVNQLVIVGLLKKMGHIAVIASSGQEGFDVFKLQPFDVVLMASVYKIK